jgi:pimeloyl-ACP methyl ester carboxylesterase
MTVTQYLSIFARRIGLVLGAVAAFHVVLGIRPAFASEPAIREYDHIRTTLHGTDGPAAVLIPGLSTPAAVWDDTVTELSGEMRLLVVEVRGMEGDRAPANEGPGMMAGIVADLSADLAARGLSPVRIVGHSFGGLLALQFGLDHPGQTESLLVIDALPFFGTVFEKHATVTSIEPQAARMRDMLLAQAETIRAAGAKGTDNPAGGAGMSLIPAQQLRIANWSLKADPAVVAQALYEDMQTDLRAQIGSLSAPVTVLYQAHQAPDLARARYQTDYAALPGANLVPVERTSHFIMLDRPELVHAEIVQGAQR